jgi:hypothetical protein
MSIDGKPAAEWTLDSVVELFKQDGKTVKLGVKSGDQERDVELALKRRV